MREIGLIIQVKKTQFQKDILDNFMDDNYKTDSIALEGDIEESKTKPKTKTNNLNNVKRWRLVKNKFLHLKIEKFEKR